MMTPSFNEICSLLLQSFCLQTEQLREQMTDKPHRSHNLRFGGTNKSELDTRQNFTKSELYTFHCIELLLRRTNRQTDRQMRATLNAFL